VVIQDSPTRALNRWSRHLSTNYKPQLDIPRWSIDTGSFWMAPQSVFLELLLHLCNTPTSGTLSWLSTRDQGSCASCWATATTDAVAAAQTIATSPAGGNVPVLSVPQVLGCSANGTSGSCSGDYPTTALEYAAGSSLLNDASYLANATCSAVPKTAPSIIMYESSAVPGLVWPPPDPAEAASCWSFWRPATPSSNVIMREHQGWCSRTPAATLATWTTQCSWSATTSQPCSLTGSSETRGETPGATAGT